MKKIFLCVVAVVITAGAYAQNIEWGAKAGLNLSNISGPEASANLEEFDIQGDVSWKMKPDFYLGFFVDIPISSKLSFQPELVYSRQGSTLKVKYSESGESADVKDKITFSTINIPLLLKVKLAEKFSLEVGPQVGFAFDAREKATGTVDGMDIDESGSMDSEAYKTVDFAAALGLSYRICPKFEVNARYNLGLTDVFEGLDGKHGVIQVGVGYRF